MPISNENRDKIDKMNRASQNVLLGTIVQKLDNVINAGSPIEYLNISGSSDDILFNVFQNGSGSAIKIGNADNYLSISNNGDIRLSGSATTWDDLRFPANSINPPGGIGGAAVDTADSPFIGTLLFDSNTTEIVAGQAQMPHKWKLGSLISPHVHWSPTSISTGSVVWQFDCDVASAHEAFSGTYTTSGSVAIYADGTINNHIVSDIIDLDMTGKGLSAIILWRISRIGGSASDTYPDDARLLEFDIHYEIDSLRSNEEYVKNT